MIKLFGAAYLFYLAYQVYKSPSKIDMKGVSSIHKKSLSWHLYKQGFIMNLLNPKVVIFFLAFFPGFHCGIGRKYYSTNLYTWPIVYVTGFPGF